MKPLTPNEQAMSDAFNRGVEAMNKRYLDSANALPDADESATETQAEQDSDTRYLKGGPNDD